MTVLLLATCVCSTLLAQEDNNAAPINYDSTEPNDRVAVFIKAMSAGDESLKWDEKHGWLPDLLNKLEIPRSSQMLVFSKTSQQHWKINASAPRAIYFNDDVYLGFVQNGDFLEIAAVDPVQGGIFYKLDQQESESPRITRASPGCLSCHESSKTQNVPGFLVRSVFPGLSGHPDYRHGTTTTDHTTSLEDRFGGWYVTGSHGEMRHRGNVFVDPQSESAADALDREAGANLDRLPARARPERHLEPTSDIVAIMILEHQSQFHNFVAQASFTTRRALYQQTEMNRILERKPDFQSESTTRRITSVAEELVRYTFFSGEYKLTSEIKGDSKFIDDFAAKAIRDSKGRSLRDLDLESRLLKYPCSYLVYSDSFCSLPPQVLAIVKRKMLEVLGGDDESRSFEHLAKADRQAILEILTETHPMFTSGMSNDSGSKN